jgi:hypothetical protein
MRFKSVVAVCAMSLAFAAGACRAANDATPTTQPLTPIETLRAYVAATHNPDPTAYRALVYANGPLEESALDAISKLIAGSAAFRQAALRKFDGADVIKYHLDAGIVALPLDLMPGLDHAVENIKGDVARVSDPMSDTYFELRRVDGKWQIPIPALLPDLKTSPDVVRQNLKAIISFADVMNETATDIGDGHFRTAEEAAVIVRLRLTHAHDVSGATDVPSSRGR